MALLSSAGSLRCRLAPWTTAALASIALSRVILEKHFPRRFVAIEFFVWLVSGFGFWFLDFDFGVFGLIQVCLFVCFELTF